MPDSTRSQIPTARSHGPAARSHVATGLTLAMTAYGLWGLFPIFFSLLASVGPFEIVTHRVIWSLVFLMVVIAARRHWAQLAAVLRSRRTVLLLAGAAVAVAVNWSTYVWAVVNNLVVESSLGYFINPLISVLLGVLLLGERLRRLQWIAVALAGVSIVVMAIGTGTPPWVGLVIALSFGVYGLLKKLAGVDAISSLTVETMVLSPVAVILLVAWEAGGSASFLHESPGISLLLLLLGPVTAIPLLAFGGAATRLPLSVLGLLQYTTPVFVFVLGITYFGESMPPARWAGFVLIWVALAILALDATMARPRPQPDRVTTKSHS